MAAVSSQAISSALPARAPATRDFAPAVAREWDGFLASQPQATPFHSAAWMRALQRTFHYENRSLYAEREGKITGVLPLFLISNWLMGRCLISVPFADYGGVCAEDGPTADALIARAKQIGVAEKVDFIELRHRSASPRPDFYVRDLYVSFDTELDSSADAQLKRLPRDTRYMIRKGAKAGLEISSGLEQLPEFYTLFARNWHRLGTPVVPRKWLEILAEEFQDVAELTMARVHGRAVCGVFSFVFGNTLFPHYSGAAPDANSMAASNFIYWELIKESIGRGIRRFDFGRSKKNTGAYHFKSAWNMQVNSLEYQVCMVNRTSPPNFSPTNPKFALASKLWSQMPLRACTWLGPHIVCWFP